MKNLNQLISSFEVKANQDDYAIVSKDDLEQTARLLKDYRRLTFAADRLNPDNTISLNGSEFANPFRAQD
jgi:hypothetical protein